VEVAHLRADQSANRQDMGLITADASKNLLKLSPLFDWTRDKVTDFAAAHGVPINSLDERDLSRSVAHPARAPSCPENRNARADGGGKTKRKKSAEYTSLGHRNAGAVISSISKGDVRFRSKADVATSPCDVLSPDAGSARLLWVFRRITNSK
jgi:3'-phosphoadenosine 5'-phosphosulfate sulfotransferase (PAPS reductase)/FAD synthetase